MSSSATCFEADRNTAAMVCISASKMAVEWDSASEVSTDLESGACCSSVESTPFSQVGSSEVIEVGTSIYFLPNSVASGVVMRNTFVDYMDEDQQDLAARSRRRSRSSPPALAAHSEQRRESDEAAVASQESLAAVVASQESLAGSSLVDSEWSSLEGVRMPIPALAALKFLKLANAACRGESVVVVPEETVSPPSADEADAADLPSVGSRMHSTGSCRPCGFFWKARGCSNGSECEFCHICDGEERKRRHRNRKTMFKAQALSQLIPPVASSDHDEEDDDDAL
eukprot:TRINITY_DN543_c0_g1_i1.p1 TRINITY_DN543_c0_g1~~TRINITY_DN543_c0_g1_i1.p1  ORF type:complete len:284 (+),score=61.39 TRINITY_DN543_c0_g1_i1:95-946(+)